jgi:hypothetical protein
MNVYFSFIFHNTFSQEQPQNEPSFNTTQHNQLPTGGWVHMAQESPLSQHWQYWSAGMDSDYIRVKILAHAGKKMLNENKPRNNEPGEVWQTFCRAM